MRCFIILLTVFLLVSCYNKTVITDRNISVIQNLSESDSIPTIDTTIFLKGIVKSNFQINNLNDSIAKKILFSYFKSKGYYNSDNLPVAEKVTDSDLCVYFNKIYLIELNGSKSKNAVITYWIIPPYASGHCLQPHKAIILNTDTGYKITNEEFIPDYFNIDSVSNIGSQVTIYGCYYDCGNNKVLKSIRARIK